MASAKTERVASSSPRNEAKASTTVRRKSDRTSSNTAKSPSEDSELSLKDLEQARRRAEYKQQLDIQAEEGRQKLALVHSRNEAELAEQSRAQRRVAAEEEARQRAAQLKQREAERLEREQREQEAYRQEATERQQRLEALRAGGVRQSGGILIAFAVIGIVVSVVDITFLKDVLGRMLGFSGAYATLLSAVIGLAAMVMLMGLQGYKEAHDAKADWHRPWYQKWEVLLWLALGIILLALRIGSGYILDIGEDDVLLNGTKIRLIDLAIGPVMFIFYLAAGSFAMYGIRNFFKSDMYIEMLDNQNTNKSRREVMRHRRMEEMKHKRDEMALIRDRKMLERQDRRRDKAAKREQRQLRREYLEARKQYEQKVKAVHIEHERISDQLSRLEASHRDLGNVGGISERLINNVSEVRSQVQGQVAMLVNAKSHISVDTLNGIIDEYNTNHPF